MRTSPETQQLVKEMYPLNSGRPLFKLAVEQGMEMNVLAAGMRFPMSNSAHCEAGVSRT